MHLNETDRTRPILRSLSISERTRRSLQELGLTDYEIRAYTTLLEAGSATANELSELSDVPYSKAYEVLGSLEKKGWVEVEHARPSKYYPKPPSVALDVTRLEVENRIRQNGAIVLEELQPLYERKEVHERPDVWIVRGEFNILAKTRETLDHAAKEILVALPVIPQAVMDALVPTLKTIIRKDIGVRVMTTKKAATASLEELSRVCDVRVRDQMFGGGVIVDGREVVLLLGEDETKQVVLAIWSDHVGLAKFAKSYFGSLWETSEPFSDRKA